MCRKMKLWGYLLMALGLGFVASGLIGSVILRVLIGVACIAIGILQLNRR